VNLTPRAKATVRAKISALGTYVPPKLLTNADLEKMVETTNDWILSRVGIRERHIAEKGVATSDLAVEAAKEALAQRGWLPEDIEVIIVGTNWGPRARGDSIFPPPVPRFFMRFKPAGN
jgi:3-oxoacyl-[acyl-carrier-protein] synthase-3